jgi:aldehyde dehydrogenase (NAD+)
MNAHQHFIGRAWTGVATSIPVTNPSDGQVMAEIARGGAAEIDAAVAAGEAAIAGE